MELRKEQGMTWDESEHPRDNEGKFTFKNGGEEEAQDKTGEEKKESDKKKEENDNHKYDFSGKNFFKLSAQYDDIRTETPAEVLYGNNSKTAKDISNQKKRNKLISKLGEKINTCTGFVFKR